MSKITEFGLFKVIHGQIDAIEDFEEQIDDFNNSLTHNIISMEIKVSKWGLFAFIRYTINDDDEIEEYFEDLKKTPKNSETK